jgi:glycyl-tRNA synthetase
MEIEKIVQIAKRRGFVWPSSEIYGGLSGFFDFGPLGVLLKRKIENFWREFFVKSEENIFEVETATIMPEKVWRASGHLESFVDPITQCKKCNSFYRADNLIQEKTKMSVEGLKPEELSAIIKEKEIKCPKCKGELSEVRVFNLMLSTQVGPAVGSISYLRPETAQGIFVNFKNIASFVRKGLPFGIAQVGRSYRNEISPRQWLIRLREFNQMEIEYFFNPEKPNPNFEKVAKEKVPILTREEQKKGEENVVEMKLEDAVKEKILPNDYIAYFIAKEFLWYQQLGIPKEAIRFRHMLPEETPHYSAGNFDMEIKFDFGWKEVVGNAYRTDHDLKSHMKHSGESFFVVESGKKIIPHVVEPSFGVDRTIYAVLLYSFREDKKRGWDWFEFQPKIAPYVAAVFPLVSKDDLPEKAREVYNMIKPCFDAYYDEAGSIGKRYARADEAGTFLGITIDYDTLKDNTVTIRSRDTTEQVRVEIKKLLEIVWKLVNKEIGLRDAGKLVTSP